MIELINSSISPSPQQAPTESTPLPPLAPSPAPLTVQDRVTLGSDGDDDYSGINAPA